MNKRAAFTALMLLLSSTIALAEENPLLGTWKLKSFVREVTATGEKYNILGEHPTGYLSYSADGRMYAIATADNRIKPLDANATDEERVKLHRTMMAYAGTYTLEGDKVIHHVDVSFNETWTGTDEVRFGSSRIGTQKAGGAPSSPIQTTAERLTARSVVIAQ